MRERIILILSALAVIGGLFALALWLGAEKPEEPQKTHKPTVSVTAGPIPTVAPSPEATATPEPGKEPEANHEEDTHNHGDEAPPADCSGPVGCSDEEVSRNTQADLDAAAAVRSKVTPFVTEWTKLDSAESPSARAARLIAVGATAEAASATSVLARANTTQTGLTVSTTPRPVQRVLFLAREGDLLKFQASLDVNARYMQPDDSGSVHVAGGAVMVYLTDKGAVAKVTDSFPSIEAMR